MAIQGYKERSMVCLVRESAFAFIHVHTFADIPMETKFGLEISTRVDHGRICNESEYCSGRYGGTYELPSDHGMEEGKWRKTASGIPAHHSALRFNTAYRSFSPLSLSLPYPHLSSTISRLVLFTSLFVSCRSCIDLLASGSNPSSFSLSTCGTLGVASRTPRRRQM